MFLRLTHFPFPNFTVGRFWTGWIWREKLAGLKFSWQSFCCVCAIIILTKRLMLSQMPNESHSSENREHSDTLCKRL